MASATSNIDRVSAILFAKSVGDRVSKRLVDALAALIDERGDDLTMDEFHDCLRKNLESALASSEDEFIAPNYGILSESIENIRSGDCYDIQEVIDDLQGATE